MGIVPEQPEQQEGGGTAVDGSPARLGVVSKGLFRGRAKSQTRINSDICLWTPEGQCCWKAISGHRVMLTPTHLLHLTEREAEVLKQIALSKLRSLNMGCKVDLPREETPVANKPKRRALLLRKKAKSTSFFEGKDKKGDGGPASGQVFGIPLAQCLQNERNKGAVAPADDLVLTSGRRDSLYGGSPFLEVPNGDYTPSPPRVPQLVNSCFRHIEQYGLHTVGIFRVSSSKKKVRQMREDIDSGQTVELDDSYHPHEVGQLLKEYFRDLPEPLLTRDLYAPFLATLKLRDKEVQLEALRMLVALLPIQNRDTLWALLRFLSKVARHAGDSRTLAGTTVSGNKMDSGNLATLFGPNILHNVPHDARDGRFQVDSPLRAQERSDVILVVTTLLDNYQRLFQVPAEDLDRVYRRLQVEDAEFLNGLLRQRFYATLERKGDIVANDRGRSRDRQALSIPTIAISSDESNCPYPSSLDYPDPDLSAFDLLTIQQPPSPRRKSFPEKAWESTPAVPQGGSKQPNHLEKRRSSFTEMLAKALSKVEPGDHPKQDQSSKKAGLGHQGGSVRDGNPKRPQRSYGVQRHATVDCDLSRRPSTLDTAAPRDKALEKSATTSFYPARKPEVPDKKARTRRKTDLSIQGQPERLRRGDLIASEYTIKSRPK